MIGAARGHALANTWTWAITSWRVSFSSSTAAAKSMLSTLAFISAICAALMLRPSSYNQIKVLINVLNLFNWVGIGLPNFVRSLLMMWIMWFNQLKTGTFGSLFTFYSRIIKKRLKGKWQGNLEILSRPCNCARLDLHIAWSAHVIYALAANQTPVSPRHSPLKACGEKGKGHSSKMAIWKSRTCQERHGMGMTDSGQTHLTGVQVPPAMVGLSVQICLSLQVNAPQLDE